MRFYECAIVHGVVKRKTSPGLTLARRVLVSNLNCSPSESIDGTYGRLNGKNFGTGEVIVTYFA